MTTQVKAGLGILFFGLSPAYGAAVLFTAFGDLATVTTTRDSFRTAIGGGTVAGMNGSFGGIRREINWDGVPDAASAPNAFPVDFFNVNSPRGVVYSTPGTGFQVSSTAGAGVQFMNLNATYPATFEPFSNPKLFTSIGSNISDTNFFLAGTTTPASTSAFGVVFSDVDLANTTTVQYFNTDGGSLGTFNVPGGAGSETFSFLGVAFNAGERVGRVRITAGNAAVGPNDAPPTTDVVVMDDFIYAEPAAVPEPGTVSLFLLGPGVFLIARRWNRS
jgi:hypothetical protein